jgi:PPP family 3-phenylpropionic acid transporter
LNPRARLASVYFAYYAGVGVFMAYFAPYLRGLGFDGKQIGATVFAQQSVAIPAALIWGGIGDRIGGRALRLAAAGACCSLALLPFARTPLQVGLVLALASAFSGGIVPLIDADAVHAAGSGYARVRLWGSIGFVFTSQGVGLLLAARGERPADSVMPFTYLLCFAAVAVAALANGAPAVPDTVAVEGAGRSRLAEGFALLRAPRVAVLVLACAVHWGANAPYNLLYGVLVRELGFSSRITGLGLAVGVASEVLALFFFPRLMNRFSLRTLFASVFLLSAARWLLLARSTSAVALVLPQILHAATFGIWWACSVEALRTLIPRRLRASGQAVFAAIVFGSGNLIGYALSGAGYDRFGGARRLFIFAAFAELIALALTGSKEADTPGRPRA